VIDNISFPVCGLSLDERFMNLLFCLSIGIGTRHNKISSGDGIKRIGIKPSNGESHRTIVRIDAGRINTTYAFSKKKEYKRKGYEYSQLTLPLSLSIQKRKMDIRSR
jgi:hypothetical protein